MGVGELANARNFALRNRMAVTIMSEAGGPALTAVGVARAIVISWLAHGFPKHCPRAFGPVTTPLHFLLQLIHDHLERGPPRCGHC